MSETLVLTPVPMLLFCPRCALQHIDAPQPSKVWTNPPHRSHECQGCGHVWRPADVATTGVASLRTRGKRDGSAVPKAAELPRLRRWISDLQAGMYVNCVYCGHRYGPDDQVPTTMADALKEHIEGCPQHPMHALKARIAELEGLINTPELVDFVKAVPLEAVHQRDRWGSEHDAGKTNADWFWLVGYLAGKALNALAVKDQDKALHHIITTAAACANWHAALLGKTNMRPGIATPPGEEQST